MDFLLKMVITTKRKNLKKNQMKVAIQKKIRKTRLRIFLENNKSKILILKRRRVMKNRKQILPISLIMLKRKDMYLRSNLSLCSGHGINDIWF